MAIKASPGSIDSCGLRVGSRRPNINRSSARTACPKSSEGKSCCPRHSQRLVWTPQKVASAPLTWASARSHNGSSISPRMVPLANGSTNGASGELTDAPIRLVSNRTAGSAKATRVSVSAP